MSRPDTAMPAPRETRSGIPIFDEPWQAHTLAIAYALVDNGVFSPAQWAETLGAALREAEVAGKPDDQHAYYEAALDAGRAR